MVLKKQKKRNKRKTIYEKRSQQPRRRYAPYWHKNTPGTMKYNDGKGVLSIPPFRIIKGKRYKYPKNKEEWKRECAKAIRYKEKRWRAYRLGLPMPPVNYYYHNLLTSPTALEKKRLRTKHRETYGKNLPKGVHIHHLNGKFDSKHLLAVDPETHIRIHRNEAVKRRRKRQASRRRQLS